MKVEHQLVSFGSEAFTGILDRYVAEGWEAVSCWPVGAGYRCLLRRPTSLQQFLDTPYLPTNTTAQALEAPAARETP